MTDKIRAPWTPEQVDALNRFQQYGGMHPFTCGNDHGSMSVVLMAHRDGWHCSAPACDYRQDWAHAFMADPSAWPKSPFGERHGPTPSEARRAAFPTVQGRCPACGNTLLFLGDGGHVTCSLDVCPNPSAPDELLHGEHATARTPLICSSDRHAAKVADLERQLAALREVARGYCPACGRGDCAPTVEDWEQQRQRADQAEELLRIAHNTSNRSEAERARAVQRAEQAEQEATDTATAAALAISLVKERAERAEAAIARVRELRDMWAKRTDQLQRGAELLTAALDGTPLALACLDQEPSAAGLSRADEDEAATVYEEMLRRVESSGPRLVPPGVSNPHTGAGLASSTNWTTAEPDPKPVPEPFFETDKVYEPKGGPRWEIRFQREGVAHFTPVRVDRDSAGLPRAYGKLSLDDDHVWTTMDRFAFRTWKPADRPAADDA